MHSFRLISTKNIDKIYEVKGGIMMAKYPPFMNATGLTTKILNKIKQAQTPERFTQDFLSTSLGFKSGGAKAFIPLAKRLGFLASDGTPSEVYKRFRNPKESKAAMAESIKKGYPELYARNEYTHDLDKKGLDGLITEATGLKSGHQTVMAIRGTFEALKQFADFKAKPGKFPKEKISILGEEAVTPPIDQELEMNLAYNINLILPKTDDIAVFNAIFKSLKDNLLKK